MALTITKTERWFEFKVKDEELQIGDPNPDFSTDEVVSFLSNTYPSLTNSNVTGPVMKDGKAFYKISSTFGEKG